MSFRTRSRSACRQIRIVCDLCQHALQPVQRPGQRRIACIARADAIEPVRCQQFPRLRLQLRVLGSVRQIRMLQLHQQPLRAIQVIRQHHQDHALRCLRILSDVRVRRVPLPVAAAEECRRQQHREADQPAPRLSTVSSRASALSFSHTESAAAAASATRARRSPRLAAEPLPAESPPGSA